MLQRIFDVYAAFYCEINVLCRLMKWPPFLLAKASRHVQHPSCRGVRPQANAKLLGFGFLLAARGVLGGNESCAEGLENAVIVVREDSALLQSRVQVHATVEHAALLALLVDADKGVLVLQQHGQGDVSCRAQSL
jgi:hypothetical protein